MEVVLAFIVGWLVVDVIMGFTLGVTLGSVFRIYRGK